MKKFFRVLSYIGVTTLVIAMVGIFSFSPANMSLSSSGGKLSLNFGDIKVYAASESKAPDAYVTQTNLDGTVGDIDEDPDSPDGNWADVVDDSLDTVAHVSFPTPSGNPTTGAGVQNFKIYVKRSTSDSSPTVKIDLYEGGVFRSATSITSSSVTSDSGELFTGTWDASSLSTPNGSGVECYIYGTKAGDNGATPTSDYPTSETSFSSGDHSDNDWEVTGELGSDDNTYDEITDKNYDNGDQTYLLKVNGFDLSSVPDGSTILGVKVDIAGYYAVSSSTYDYMKLLDTGGNPVGNDVLTPGSATLSSSETTSTFGSSSELWGNSLTPAWVKDSDFGVCFGLIADGNNADIFLDWLTLTVYYTEGDTYSSVSVGAVEWNVDYSSASVDISNTPSSKDFGVVDESSTYWSNGSAPTGGSGDVTEYVPSSGYDTGRWSTTSFSSTLSGVYLGNDGAYNHASVAFSTVNIPQGANITTAYLSFYANDSRSNNTMRILIKGNDVDSATPPTDYTEFDALASNATDAGVDWDGEEAWTVDNWYDTPSIIDIVQEIVDRVGWEADNTMQFMLYDDSSDTNASRKGESYDSDNVHPCMLYIEYDNNVLEDGDCYFAVTNNSGAPVDITIEATDFIGGVGWNLVASSPGSNEVVMTAYKSGEDFTTGGLVITNSPQSWITDLPDSASQYWEIKLQTGSAFTDGVQKSSTVTLTGSL